MQHLLMDRLLMDRTRIDIDADRARRHKES
jgi:hypothetical protein